MKQLTKKTFLMAIILPLIISCNAETKRTAKDNPTQNAKEIDTTQVTKEIKEIDTTSFNVKTDAIPINGIKLNQPLAILLKPYNLTKDDNSNLEYNVNLDYEEFAFDVKYKYKYNDVAIGKIKSLVVFYLKNDKSTFCYELELENNPNCKKILAELKNNFGKNTFYKKVESTKARPAFVDNNGEPETDHIIQELTKWNDDKNKANYYVISKENLTTKENKLTVIVISTISKKSAEWIDYRSLKMVFD
ncbi:hypothetical protein EZJ43_07925 [Pedobacter changchengzhani]|uniref:Lipoprotein n=1 Tax=Pedobacter changchengzhani TaxID=2529274 RepID=A0A4R5ML15_9SPHI|nr:hypothetical protein [Pedobacter changchengzhani]TDG36437.1 hypothetical protein EZJ43_07925 [Pedobacter changchengzhani]